MKQFSAMIILFLVTIGPAAAAETTERMESLPDSHPECMQVNGPDCVLGSPRMSPRVTAPPVTVVPHGVVVSPATIIAPVSASPVTSETEVTDVIMPPPAQRRITGAQGK
jgi:hypothetical protein